jgi:hypothetical protein
MVGLGLEDLIQLAGSTAGHQPLAGEILWRQEGHLVDRGERELEPGRDLLRMLAHELLENLDGVIEPARRTSGEPVPVSCWPIPRRGTQRQFERLELP